MRRYRRGFLTKYHFLRLLFNHRLIWFFFRLFFRFKFCTWVHQFFCSILHSLSINNIINISLFISTSWIFWSKPPISINNKFILMHTFLKRQDNTKFSLFIFLKLNWLFPLCKCTNYKYFLPTLIPFKNCVHD